MGVLRSRSLAKHLYLAVAYLILGVCAVLARKFLGENNGIAFISNMVGTVTWAGLVTILVILMLAHSNRWIRYAPGISVGICCSIEFLQLTRIPDIITGIIPPARLIVGSTFSWFDLPWYVLGVALTGVLLLTDQE